MFYIQPPKGLMTLPTLEDVVFTRWKYLNLIQEKKSSITFNDKFEYLLEGSPHDCVGHFTLRLLTLRSSELFTYWMNKEVLLLRNRLSVVQPRQVFRLFRTMLRHLKRRIGSINPVDNILYSICSFYITTKMFKHITSGHHDEICQKYHHRVNFELIPEMIEARSVILNKGLATIYCSQWKELFQSLFKTFIIFESKYQKQIARQLFTDPRFQYISKKLQQGLNSQVYKVGKITTLNIDNEVSNFPLCMQHMHFQLRLKHRLSHYARFYYTLFLKECGMSLEESLLYWRNEYSKPHNCKALCNHDWQTDAKKFIYSIRHMYGLEGGRKDYKTPSCKDMYEQFPGAAYEGGCPFSNFDMESLQSLLSQSMTKNKVNEFLVTNSNEEPKIACLNYFKIQSTTETKNINITRPVQYYQKMTEANEFI
ncbi:probable DNA primase large subunit isoform X1 [Trichogramma pretiosum]|uniref:probable DNA primase large subunit isoform X1 n=1 Tax=Trichogramma pretiosum TaxID=7493 RepID=UPI0006C98111|nr:probable DNA primase large subunit isoform X1 [Trichogramma pretiosum]